VSLASLGTTIAPCLLYFAGLLDLDQVKIVTLIGTIVWFIATPLWMGRDLPVDAKEVEI
jgi:hypothetical protein